MGYSVLEKKNTYRSQGGVMLLGLAYRRTLRRCAYLFASNPCQLGIRLRPHIVWWLVVEFCETLSAPYRREIMWSGFQVSRLDLLVENFAVNCQTRPEATAWRVVICHVNTSCSKNSLRYTVLNCFRNGR